MEIPKIEGLIKIDFTEEEGTWYGNVSKSVKAKAAEKNDEFTWESVQQVSAGSIDELKGKLMCLYPQAYQE